MKKQNFLTNFLITFIITSIFALLCFFEIFQKLDYRLYDYLFKLKKDVPLNEKIMMVKIDDPSIKELGEWPWSRDIIADVLLRLKEFDSKLAVFDIEYISNSKAGISPTAQEKINSSISNANDNIDALISQLSTAIKNGYFSKDELSDLTNELISSQIDPSFFDLNNYITNNIYRDNDEYFAQSLQFFGNAYLTVNNRDLGYTVTKDQIDYIRSRMLIKNVIDEKSRIKIDNEYSFIKKNDENTKKGFQPALYKLITHCKNVGYTNSNIDNDGTRRRFELFYEYDNLYLPQLVISPLLDLLQVESVTRTKHFYIFNNALIPGNTKRENIKIPVDDHGCMLLNWRKGLLDKGFNSESIINIITLDRAEANIYEILKYIYDDDRILDSNGFEMPYSIAAKELLDIYSTIRDKKEELLLKCSGFDENSNALEGISDSEYKDYYDLRNYYYSKIGEFLDNNYLESINQRLEELKAYVEEDIIAETSEYINGDFETLKSDYDLYTSLFNDLSQVFKGAYCILGNTAVSTTDLGATPFLKKYENVGLHANLMNTILNRDFIYYVSWIYGFLFTLLLIILSFVFVNKAQHVQNIIGGIGIFVIFFIFCILFVAFDIYIPFVGTTLYALLTYMVFVVRRFLISNKEKRLITDIASSFANKETVDLLRKNPDLFDTKGQKKNITALFSDVQKFSTLSENIAKQYGDEGPNKLIEILNEYLGSMSNEILINQGTIDKYEGDAIIAMFGAPDSLNLHTKEEWAYLCLDSAIRMKKAEVIFNNEHPDLFKPMEVTNAEGEKEIVQLSPLQTRIGINTGEAYVGLMGSKTPQFSKLNYTMMGDTVNLASRLEGVNKAYKSWIMCSGDTWKMADSGINKNKITARKLDRVKVVGKNLPVELYNILGFTSEISEEENQMILKFNEAMDYYNNQDFSKAGKLFLQADQIFKDETSIIFANRCKDFIENGLPKGWNGVVTMTSK